MRLTAKSLTIAGIGLFQLITLLVIFLFIGTLNYVEMSLLGIVVVIVDILVITQICKIPFISIPNIFSILNLFFNLGQIIKEAFNLDGFVPLPFENYADLETIQLAFWFYILSQTLFMVGVGVICSKAKASTIATSFLAKSFDSEALFIAKVLLIIGFLPRIYIDFMSLTGAMAQGYEGVYSLYIPQPVRSLAFFFDAGLVFLLYYGSRFSWNKYFFLSVILYKCLIMASGGRQDKVAFLLIWIYVFVCVVHRLTIKKTIFLFCASVLGFLFISSIGEIRTSGAFNIIDILELIISGENSYVLGNALGEFGSAFDTLEVAIQYTPEYISYGYGKTYIAGIISIIPLIVKQFPFLDESVLFICQLPTSIVFAFGGSYLGELYYNFSWFGILGSYIVGMILGNVHVTIIKNGGTTLLQKGWASILGISLILFIRGYFTDMVQQLIWTYFLMYLICSYVRKKRHHYD